MAYGDTVEKINGQTFRDRKKHRTRQDLATAALRLFSERGYEAVTVDEIAEQAWVSPRTFFRYFPSKEDVLWLGSEDQVAVLHSAILARPDNESALDAVHHAMSDLVDGFSIDPEPLILRARIVAETPGLLARDLLEQTKWEHAVKEAIAERLDVDVESDAEPALIAVATGGALRVAFGRWIKDGCTGDLRELITDSLASLRRAICNTPETS